MDHKDDVIDILYTYYSKILYLIIFCTFVLIIYVYFNFIFNLLLLDFFFFFFFQAEDGIRDIGVTGVQTCALPIFLFTSETTTGQIYVPRINWLLFAAVVILCVLFGTSTNLASAYGIAVTATMVVEIGRASCRERV